MTEYVFKAMQPADTDALVRTVYGEARNQSLDGQQAVMCAIRNRAVLAFAYVNKRGKVHPLFGDGSIYKVCHAPYQFSCWNKNDPNAKIIEALPISGRPYTLLKENILKWLNEDDITHGSTHYCTKAVAKNTEWAKNETPAASFGTHLFYNNIG